MRERAKALVGPRAAKDLVVSTFHSLGVRMLRSDGDAHRPEGAVLASSTATTCWACCATPAAAPTTRWRGAGSGPSACGRTRAWTARGAAGAAADDDERVAARVMQRYEERLAAYQAVDFDDLIGLPLKLLQRDAEARAKWQEQFRHVLVDEVPGHQRRAVRAAEGAGRPASARAVHRGGRRRPEHLRLARRDHRQPEAPAAGLPDAEGDRAGAELPLHRPHPARRQRGDRRQPQAVREEAVERVRRRRAGARGRVRRRGARGRARGGAHPGAAGAGRRGRSSATSPCSTAPTTRRACSSRSCARRRSRTRCRAGRASSTAPRSRTCAPGCACWSTRTTTRPSCAR